MGAHAAPHAFLSPPEQSKLIRTSGLGRARTLPPLIGWNRSLERPCLVVWVLLFPLATAGGGQPAAIRVSAPRPKPSPRVRPAGTSEVWLGLGGRSQAGSAREPTWPRANPICPPRISSLRSPPTNCRVCPSPVPSWAVSWASGKPGRRTMRAVSPVGPELSSSRHTARSLGSHNRPIYGGEPETRSGSPALTWSAVQRGWRLAGSEPGRLLSCRAPRRSNIRNGHCRGL